MRAHILISTLALVAAPALASAGQIIIINSDGPNEGFNDPTPVAPIGGNPGTTRGQQRLNVFERAADIWEGVLHPINDIYVLASIDPLASNVLGSAGATSVFSNFPGAEYPDTWYHSALADQLAGTDLNPGAPDIRARFSSNFAFYLGFDNNEGAAVDLLPVVLHELGHGLGFSNFVDETGGTKFLNTDDIYSHYTLDVTTDQVWTEMTDAARKASAVNLRKVSWSGIHVNQDVPGVLLPGEPSVRVVGAPPLGALMVGDAAFGPRLTATGVTGALVLGNDGVGATTDACTPLVNNVAGKVVLVDRGTCAFTVKVANAQAAGAIAVLVADSVAGGPPPGLGGVDPSIVISAGRITLADGNALKAALAGGAAPTVTLGLDMSILAGTDRVRGYAMVAALDPVAPGSSISHFEAVAFRNQLMEPAINVDLTSSVQPPEDLTRSLMVDIGWFSDADGVPDGADECLGSDRRATVVIAACDSGVVNTTFGDGCRISDQIDACLAGAANHGGFVSCVAHLTDGYRDQGVITGVQAGAIRSCAARAP